MHTGVQDTLPRHAPGKHFGWLRLPYSVDRSPFWTIQLPICVVANGDGPRLLLMAGNHGDEYEGPLVLAELMRRIESTDIRGKLTILPAANSPALMNATRNSPIDGGNLNRVFPGDAAGSPTQRIANYLETVLFPEHDVVFDLHSGGTSTAHLGCAITLQADDARDQDRRALATTLGLGHVLVASNEGQPVTSLGGIARSGALGVSAELGGGATTTPQSLDQTRRAIDNLMLHVGLTQRRSMSAASEDVAKIQLLQLRDPKQLLYAERPGWFEPAVKIGDDVKTGQLAGRLHFLDEPMRTPEELHFQVGGIVINHRLHTHAMAGDCLIGLASEWVPD